VVVGIARLGDSDAIRDAPRAQSGDDPSGEEERRHYEHYGQTYPGKETPGEEKSDKPGGASRKPGLLRRLLGRNPR
jgi:hypothetical protein